MERLDKFLANQGVGTRTQVKEFLKKGQVRVNGDVIKKPETKIDPEKDKISYLGNEFFYEKFSYYMLHKPGDCVSATFDNHSTTVIDLITDHPTKDLFPVGRLDKDTEGLLLITNDGDLAHNLLSPSKHVDKKYYVEATGQLSKDSSKAFLEGIDIGEKNLTKPATFELIEYDSSLNLSKGYITIQEGKFHQIKRMFQVLECEVTYLKRISMGSLTLDENLAIGDYRPLTEEEITKLKSRGELHAKK